jgi:hypothetical protein
MNPDALRRLEAENQKERERLARQSEAHAKTQRAEDERVAARKAATAGKRPRLTAPGVVEYLDWVTSNLETLDTEHIGHHMRAAELVVRVHMGNAQAKDTQHTLVRDGIMEAPTA